MEKLLVSIITPSYNCGKFIDYCIKSVLAQDYPNVEHIIQDGGSTDDTLKILNKYSDKKYRDRIKWVSARDSGQSDALNRALQRSSGDIILVLNADDMLMPYAVSWGVEQMSKYKKVGVVYGDTYIIDEKNEITDIYKAKDYNYDKLVCLELVPPAQAAFIRKSSLKKVGFWVDSELDTCPDYEMWVRIIQKYPMKHVFGVITKYRHHKKPQLDSKSPREVQRFIDSKRIVMQRLFNSPKIKLKIRKLRRRAYAGLYLWASYVSFDMKQPKGGVYYLFASFIIRPRLKTFIRIVQTFKLLSYFALLRLIKSL